MSIQDLTGDLSFAQPAWFLLFLLVPVLIWRRRRTWGRSDVVMRLPDAARLVVGNTWRTWIRRGLPILRWLAIGLLVVGMTRPQKKWQEQKVKADAVDIMLAMDISPSMLSKDFRPDRLTVAKRVAADFVNKRPYDRLGLVGFSAEAFTQCPLTADHLVLQGLIEKLKPGRLEDGTAIGMGLATAVNRLKDSPVRSKIVILLTDGENNAGYIQPMQAAEIANTLGIRVYTIGIGSEGVVMSPARRNPDGTYAFAPRYMQFDAELLLQIARLTGGRFFRAESAADLTEIYEEIDRLEKTNIEITTKRHLAEMAFIFIGAAAILLLLEVIMRWIFLRSITP